EVGPRVGSCCCRGGTLRWSVGDIAITSRGCVRWERQRVPAENPPILSAAVSGCQFNSLPVGNSVSLSVCQSVSLSVRVELRAVRRGSGAAGALGVYDALELVGGGIEAALCIDDDVFELVLARHLAARRFDAPGDLCIAVGAPGTDALLEIGERRGRDEYPDGIGHEPADRRGALDVRADVDIGPVRELLEHLVARHAVAVAIDEGV